MKRYILLVITIFGLSTCLKAGNPIKNTDDNDPDSSKQKKSKSIVISDNEIYVGNNIIVRSSISKKINNEQADRIEQKTFSNINDIELDHKYGNIIIKESNSKNVVIEIQYFDSKRQKASCELTIKNKLLIINTIVSGKDNTKINYIINLPKNTGLSTLLRYGNMKADKISGNFEANLAYSNLDIETITTPKVPITIRYGKINIGEAQNVSVMLAYSDFIIGKAKIIDLSGRYNKISINNADNVNTKNSSAYNSYSIGKIGDFTAEMKYDKIKIDDLLSSLNVSCAYSDIIIGIKSPNVNDVKVKGIYSDILINLDKNISSSFDSQVKYGDLIISKVHRVKYSEEIIQSNNCIKKGLIGNKTPNTNIVVSNTYSDIKIR